MTPTQFTVELEPMPLHPEVALGAPAIRFSIPCFWVRKPPDPRVEWKAVLATELSHSVIPRFVLERAAMRIDDLSVDSHVTWRGRACYVGTARFGLPVNEWPRPAGQTTDANRPLGTVRF